VPVDVLNAAPALEKALTIHDVVAHSSRPLQPPNPRASAELRPPLACLAPLLVLYRLVRQRFCLAAAGLDRT
jgi:hypothetical protein